jgi:hypothetical protein
MRKHLNFILVGVVLGILPGLIILTWRGLDNGGGINLAAFSNTVGISLVMGGIPGAICGWFGGALTKNYWGAALGGLVGSAYWAVAAATMM